MKHSTFPVYFLFILFVYQNGVSQATPHQMVERMGRGINLGNVLSAPIEGNWAPAVEETYFDDVIAVGFKTVRIPIRFDEHTTKLETVNYKDVGGNYIGSINDYVVETSYLDRIEEVTDWAINKGLVAIIDVHGDHWFWESYRQFKQGNPNPEYKTGADREAAVDRFKAIWTAISNRFQNKSENLLFEIMNEAYFSMNASEVDNINTQILEITRISNPTRNVIVNGGGKNSYEAPLQLATSYPDNNNYLHNDPYLIATFHYYWPRAFTASASQEHNDFDWGTPEDKAEIDTNFQAVKDWSTTNNIPMFFGEFGADNEGGFNYYTQTYGAYGGPENASRVEFHRYLAQKAIDLGFSFTAWDAGDKAGKTIYKATDRTWVEDVKDALLGEDLLGLYKNEPTELSFKIHPNPAKNIAFFKTDKPIRTIKLFNELGKEVCSYKSDLQHLNLANLKPGIYILKINLEDNTIINKKILINF
ncbi:cellulase family glycosylhydrolase [Mariniflexile sp. HNIBRBA6329]|uniref:cellulase family glycosylhydrolase n=1 Tax=Mariniflexile sp. HNIBRBA6329 TaxID=3373088 RepID=UPI003746CFB3